MALLQGLQSEIEEWLKHEANLNTDRIRLETAKGVASGLVEDISSLEQLCERNGAMEQPTGSGVEPSGVKPLTSWCNSSETAIPTPGIQNKREGIGGTGFKKLRLLRRHLWV